MLLLIRHLKGGREYDHQYRANQPEQEARPELDLAHGPGRRDFINI